MKKVYNVTVMLKDAEGNKHNCVGTIEFAKTKENDYGNGYHMAVKIPDLEAFGMGVYDIRYDSKFRSENMIGYMTEHYTERFDGTNSKWRFVGISAEEAE